MHRTVAALAVAMALAGCGSDAEAEPASLDGVIADSQPAATPFEGMTQTELLVGEERLRVVVADEPAERGAGLRGRTDLDPYDGMLFVHEADTTTTFTMSGVDEPLDLAFYDAEGDRIGGHEMAPCPGGSGCPSYEPPGPWRYALETRPGDLPDGPLRAP